MATYLAFSALDDLAFASEGGELDIPTLRGKYAPKKLGPILELLMLVEGNILPRDTAKILSAHNGASPLLRAFATQEDSWGSDEGRYGLLRTKSSTSVAVLEGFLLAARRAAANIAGLQGSAPLQLVAAMEELRSNILDHSEAETTGLIAFRAAKGEFEFVAADTGIGVLQSLTTCTDYSHLTNDGDAMRLALHDGTSRHGSASNHGYGFCDLFRSLTYLRAFLRFRSGGSALTIDGVHPGLESAQLSQKPMYRGFFIGVRCRDCST